MVYVVVSSNTELCMYVATGTIYIWYYTYNTFDILSCMCMYDEGVRSYNSLDTH